MVGVLENIVIPMRSMAALLPAILLLASSGASAAPNNIFLEGGGGNYNLNKVHSLQQNYFKTVVRQKYDYSCGSAALATLLTHHYSHPVDELNVLDAMYENGDQEKIRKEGFSLLDMKNYLQSIGYKAEGYKESLDKLNKVGIPAIVLINRRNYMHFVVVKGVSDDRVAVGDPTLGLRIYNRQDFEKMWNGIIFVILSDKNIGRTSFNTINDWTTNGYPKFRHMLDNGNLGNLGIDTSITPNYY